MQRTRDIIKQQQQPGVERHVHGDYATPKFWGSAVRLGQGNRR